MKKKTFLFGSFYVYINKFIRPAVSSWSTYTPPTYLSNENGLITIFIDDRSYYERFHVSAYAKGMWDEDSTHFSGWTIADEPLNGTNQVLVKEIIQKGNDLGKTDALLLKKIEELTLYVLEQNEQLQKQKKENFFTATTEY